MLVDRVKHNPGYPALLLERVLNATLRRQMRYLSGTITLAGIGGSLIFSRWAPTTTLLGFGFIALGLFLAVTLLEFFYRANYFQRRQLTTGGIDLAVGQLIIEAEQIGYLEAFSSSAFGGRVLARLGFSPAAVNQLLVAKETRINDLKIPLTDPLDWPRLARALFTASTKLKTYCAKEGITAADYAAAVKLVAWEDEMTDRRRRWWSREALDQLPTIGENWAYGQLNRLKKYTTNATTIPFSLPTTPDDEALRQMENILNRRTEANVLLVGLADGGRNLVAALARRSPTSRRFLILNGPHFFAVFKNRHDFEAEFLALLDEAARTGNVVLVIENLPALLTGATTIGSDLVGLLDPYLIQPFFQIVALVETRAFHNQIEPLVSLMNRFELIRYQTESDTGSGEAFWPEIRAIEQTTGIFFTLQALREMIRAAESYFSAEGPLGAEVRDLLVEIEPWLKRQNLTFVTKEIIADFLEEKTKIPQGELKLEERGKLLELEKILHRRIIGQTEAVKAVAEALRRSRTGLNNRDRPVATFLFLGPTGVGKTETAKALAEVVFGDEKKLLRLDMSEYQSENAVERLIGSLTVNQAGTLVSLVRREPFGVILLDEFEKSHREVRNLFLQILDEGFFSDQFGQKVFLRQHLIIATSNAAADLIWEIVKTGKDLAAETGALIDQLVRRELFTPELLNRFDATIVFKPLAEEELKLVAERLLARLAKRLMEQGIELIITPILTATVATRGANRVFGARPMQRFIQETIEDVISRGIITGAIAKGAKVSFTGQGEILPELGLALSITADQ